MREPIELIEYRLLKLGLPPKFVAQHLQGVARWRTEHPSQPPRIERKRLHEPDDQDEARDPTGRQIAADGHRAQRGATADLMSAPVIPPRSANPL